MLWPVEVSEPGSCGVGSGRGERASPGHQSTGRGSAQPVTTSHGEAGTHLREKRGPLWGVRLQVSAPPPPP